MYTITATDMRQLLQVADCDRQAYPNETGPVSVFYPDGDPCILHKQRRKFVHFAAFLFNK